MTVIPFQADHLKGFHLQTAQAVLQSDLTPDYAESLEKSGDAFSAEKDGKIIAVAGIIHLWPGRGTAWALFSPAAMAKENYRSIYKACKRLMHLHTVRRIECYVDCDFPKGHRFARSLGFQLECERMRAFLPDGKDSALYSRVN